MAYTQINSKGETYYLHEFNSSLKGGRTYRNYFFGKAISAKGTPIDVVPAGRVVVENSKTGLLVLKRGQALYLSPLSAKIGP